MNQDKMKELEKAMIALKQENTKENMNQLMQLMEQCTFVVPALLPVNTDPRLVKQIVDSGGKETPLPRGVNPRPVVLENKEGKRFLSLYTSQEQAEKGEKKFPLTLGLPFQTCMELLARDKGIAGFVLNAFDQNIILNIDISKQKKPEQKKVKLTEPQLHAVLRQQVESTVLPKALFEKKEELLEEIKEREGEVLLELYGEVYPEQVACPYSADDFEVMALNIRDDLTIVRIAMPAARQVAGTCPVVLVAWNPLEKTLRYFGIVRGNDGQAAHIMEALEDGSKADLGEAPPEGSELQYIINLSEE